MFRENSFYMKWFKGEKRDGAVGGEERRNRWESSKRHEDGQTDRRGWWSVWRRWTDSFQDNRSPWWPACQSVCQPHPLSALPRPDMHKGPSVWPYVCVSMPTEPLTDTPDSVSRPPISSSYSDPCMSDTGDPVAGYPPKKGLHGDTGLFLEMQKWVCRSCNAVNSSFFFPPPHCLVNWT